MLAGDEATIDELLAREPANIAALIRKADIRASAGDERVATAFYRAALKVAAMGSVPGGLSSDLARAQTESQRATQRFVDYLEDTLASAGFGPNNRPPRFQESIDILMGRRSAEMTLQQPRSYYFPGLPQRRYYERSEFPWAAELEQQAGAIREEVLALGDDESRFQPYLYTDTSRPLRGQHGLIDSPDWSTLMLWDGGAPVEGNIEHFPRTAAAVEKLDLVHMDKRAPCIMFSRLKAGAHITPHTGLLNVRLVCHLGLIIPEGCMFRVGGQDREWHEGELLVFDDSVMHEAVNKGTKDRIILIFEIWRPELSQEERQAVTVIFDAISSYSG